MKWVKERHGSGDYGWRAPGLYVGRSPKGFWRVWREVNGSYALRPEVCHGPDEAKRLAESLV